MNNSSIVFTLNGDLRAVSFGRASTVDMNNNQRQIQDFPKEGCELL